MALETPDLELIARSMIEPLIERMERGFARLEVRLESMDGRLGSMDDRLGSMDDRLGSLQSEVRTGFRALESRIEQVVVNTGTHWRDHERRLQRIELSLAANGGGAKHDDDDDDEDEDENDE